MPVPQVDPYPGARRRSTSERSLAARAPARLAWSLACSARGPPWSARVRCTRAISSSTVATASATVATCSRSPRLRARSCSARRRRPGRGQGGLALLRPAPDRAALARPPAALAPVAYAPPTLPAGSPVNPHGNRPPSGGPPANDPCCDHGRRVEAGDDQALGRDHPPARQQPPPRWGPGL